MRRDWAFCLIGAWIAGSVFMMIVATQNFHTVDRLLEGSENRAFRSVAQELGPARTRDLMRYVSSELNRLYFQGWNVAQLALGASLLWMVRNRRDARRARTLIAAMVGIVVVMLVWLTPEITALGRRLDFVPRDPAPAELGRFWTLHAAYTVLEVVKLVAVVAAALLLSPKVADAVRDAAEPR